MKVESPIQKLVKRGSRLPYAHFFLKFDTHLTKIFHQKWGSHPLNHTGSPLKRSFVVLLVVFLRLLQTPNLFLL